MATLRITDIQRTYSIYVLFDERTPDAIRYVGATYNPSGRLKFHNWEGRTSTEHSHRLNWLRSVAREGAMVGMTVLLVVADEHEAAREETRLIAEYRARGYDLANGTLGGEGLGAGFGGVMYHREPRTAEERERRLAIMRSPEVRAKMSASAKARPPSRLGQPGKSPSLETRAKLSAALKGRPKTPEHAAKVGAAHKGRPKPASVRAKISASKIGNVVVSVDARAAISAKLTGIKRSEETRAKMKEAQRKRVAVAKSVNNEQEERDVQP